MQEALERLMVGRTVLIIAHRLSTVKNADVVMVMDDHRIQATGKHNELLQTSQLYQSLVKHQLTEGPSVALTPDGNDCAVECESARED